MRSKFSLSSATLLPLPLDHSRPPIWVQGWGNCVTWQIPEVCDHPENPLAIVHSRVQQLCATFHLMMSVQLTKHVPSKVAEHNKDRTKNELTESLEQKQLGCSPTVFKPLGEIFLTWWLMSCGILMGMQRPWRAEVSQSLVFFQISLVSTSRKAMGTNNHLWKLQSCVLTASICLVSAFGALTE